MIKRIVMAMLFVAVLVGSAAGSYAAFFYREPLRVKLSLASIKEHARVAYDDGLGQMLDHVFSSQNGRASDTKIVLAGLGEWVEGIHFDFSQPTTAKFANPKPIVVPVTTPPLVLTNMKAVKDKQWEELIHPAAYEPSAGLEQATAERWKPEADTLSIEAVLVPRQVTVVSSSQDGRIAKVHVDQGDRFKKGDILIEYDCADLEAEASIAEMQKNLTAKKTSGGEELFKLDIISDVDRMGIQVEDKQASARVKLYDARIDHCQIKAEFDGHVSNRLANPGEYTRTDRVLMEVASDEPLQAEFLVPSKWLRWVNTGAPLNITINETEATYPAKISRIYGKVDPVSQSVQMIALLDSYKDALLPGMSGQAKLSISQIEKAGVKGYLQTPAGP